MLRARVVGEAALAQNSLLFAVDRCCRVAGYDFGLGVAGLEDVEALDPAKIKLMGTVLPGLVLFKVGGCPLAGRSHRSTAPASDRLVDQGDYTVPIADHDLLTRE